jgi:outer membrane protein assembly factor BamE (lipoprotein component of BamABCDE complex)
LPKGKSIFRMLNRKYCGALLGFLACAAGCGAPYHARQVQEANSEKRLTLGAVQQTVRKGMSGGEVIEALGSPNVVSTDEHGNEVWVYDKFATDVVASEGGWSVIGGVVGAGSGAAGGAAAGFNGRSGASSASQRTLTVVVKFDENKKVRDFAYHASRF